MHFIFNFLRQECITTRNLIKHLHEWIIMECKIKYKINKLDKAIDNIEKSDSSDKGVVRYILAK